MDSANLKAINDAKVEKGLVSVRHQEGLAHTDNVAQTVLSTTESLIKYLEGHVSKAEVVNQLESIATPDIEYVVKALEVLDQTIKDRPTTDLSGVTQLMQELVNEAKLIPKEHPETPENEKPLDYTKQLSGLADAIKAVEKVVKAQKLVAEAPIVNVEAPNVKVDAPDLSNLQGGFRDVVKAVQQIVLPEYKTDNKTVEKLLKESNKYLKNILEKPVRGGGGGGQAWTAVDANGIPMPLNLDSNGNLKVTSTGGGGGADVQYTDGDSTITHPIGTIPVYDNAGTITAVSVANPLPVTATVSTTGLATSTKQDTGNISLASIDTKTPALGQALAAASTPIVLTAAQITTLTPPAALTNYANETGGNLDTIAAKDFATQTTLALIKAKTDNLDVALSTRAVTGLTDTQLRATPVPISNTNLDVALSTRTKPADQQHAIVDSSALPTGAATSAKQLPDGHNVVVTSAPTTAVTGTFFQATQPVSAASLPLPTGAATGAKQDTGNASLGSIDTKLSGTLTVDDVGPTALIAFVTTVTTAGTRVQLSSNAIEGAVLQAPSTNTGVIYVGGSNVSSSVFGAELQPGQATGLAIDNANKIWIDASVNGDKMSLLGG